MAFHAYVRKKASKSRRCSGCREGGHECDLNCYDCGCFFDVCIGGPYEKKSIACMVAARQCVQPGTRGGGLNTGGWHVEDEAENYVESGERSLTKPEGG